MGEMNIACMHQSDLRTERKSPGNRHADPCACMKRRGSLLDGPVFEAGWLNIQADLGKTCANIDLEIPCYRYGS